jgi:hypothetical protein
MASNVGLNTPNKAELYKLAMNDRKAGESTADNKPEYMKSTGSIFNAQTTHRPGKGFNWVSQNHGEGTTRGAAPKGEGNEETPNSKSAMSQARNMGGTIGGLRGSTSGTQHDADTSKEAGKNAQRLDKTIDKGDKRYQAAHKKDLKEQQKTNVEIAKNTVLMKTEQAIITDLTAQMTTLGEASAAPAGGADPMGGPSNSVYSLASAGEEQTAAQNGTTNAFTTGGSDIGGTSDANAQEIENLSTQLDESIAKMDGYSKANVKLQQVSQRQVKQMNVTNQNYVRTNNANQKAMENEHKTADKVIDVANTVDKVGQITSTVGMTLSIIGQVMEKIPYTAVPGAFIHGVGETANAVGSYASCAANVTKTVAYASKGDIQGALMSAGSAIMSGASAVASTQAAGKAFEGANKASAAAKAAGGTAKEAGKAAQEALKATAAEGAKEGAKAGGSSILKETMQYGQQLQTVAALFPPKQQQPGMQGKSGGSSASNYVMDYQTQNVIARNNRSRGYA